MADLVDFAATIEVEHVLVELTRINPAIPAGVAGECDDCGEHMPRLVAGRCGFCRDGRRIPLSWFDQLPVVPALPPAAEEPDMPNDTSLNVSVHLRGDTLAAVRTRAALDGIAITKAAGILIAEAVAAPAARDPAPAPAIIPTSAAAYTTEQLLAELTDRLAASVSPAAFEEVVARATAAEERVNRVFAVVTEVQA